MENATSYISDDVLLTELSKRVERYKNAVDNLNSMNKQLLTSTTSSRRARR
ncbi:MAG: hypothetical protein IJ933_06470 [Bacteroidales bacterium]|nr:hypothetical protein [Bacteroidales bacterium]